MKTYVFLIDADNTLFPVGANIIPEETIKTIKQAQTKGHIFAICTGRGLKDTLRIKGSKCFNYIAALTGTEIYDIKKKTIIQSPQPMNLDSIKRFIDYCEKKGCGWTYKTKKGENSLFHFDKTLPFSAKKVSKKVVEKDLRDGQFLQMLVNCKVNKKFESLFPEFKFIMMPGEYADVLNIDVSKAKGVEFFKAKFPKAKIVAIGDAKNDVGMFEVADIAVAMGNATRAVKLKADFVTKTVQENGVACVLKDILKGGK